MDSDDIRWQPGPIVFSYLIGEYCLFRLTFQGVRYSPNIFKTANSLLRPPRAAMSMAGAKVAYIFSCPVHERLPKISLRDKYIRYVDSQSPHLLVKTKGDFQQYLSRFSRKTWSSLRKKVRNVSALSGEDEFFRRHSNPTEMAAFLEQARKISEKTYQEKLLNEGLPTSEKFKNSIMQQSSAGNVFGYLLFIQDQPVAYTLCPVYDGNKVIYGHTGYDPEYAQYSPGTVLQFKIIEDLFRNERIDFYDLCIGAARHKQLFATDSRLCGNIYYFPLLPQYALPLLLRLGLDTTLAGVKRIFEYVGIKDRIKRYVRQAS